MSILTQKTVSKKISFSGVGIHSGKKVNLNILPSGPNSGIIFKRVDLNKNNIVYPLYNNVTDTTLCTTISNEYGIKVSTIEHLMAAFYGIGIDNAIIEMFKTEKLPFFWLKGLEEEAIDIAFKYIAKKGSKEQWEKYLF